jgi:hypothetical protein
MADDWAKATAKKGERRLAEEAERAATQRKRYDEGVERFRKQTLDLVAAINANIAADAGRIQAITLDDGIILAAAYKRIVTVEKVGRIDDVPASVGRIGVVREDRKAVAPPEPEELYITSSGTQTTFYRRSGGQLKIFGDADFKQLIEYFAS